MLLLILIILFILGFFELPSHNDLTLRNNYLNALDTNMTDEEGNLLNSIDFSNSTRRVISFTHWNPDFIKKLFQTKVEDNKVRTSLPRTLSVDEGLKYG